MFQLPYRRLVTLVFLLLCSPSALALDTISENNFLPAEKAFVYDVSANVDDTLSITWRIAPGYYMYRQRLKVEGAPLPVDGVNKPKGKLIKDAVFGKSEVYHDQVVVSVAPGDAKKLNLTWQGCAEAGLCYPPQHATLDLADYGIDSADNANSGARSATRVSANGHSASALTLAKDQSLAARLAGGHLAWTLLVFFGLGLLLVFTPCVLPMVPILSSIVVGAGARRLRGFTLSLAFVLPMALTYAVLGVVAALAGAHLQATLQTPAVLGVFAGIFTLLALAMFGAFDLQLPAPIRNRLNRASANRRGGHLASAAALGVLSAVLVGPCMTAPLAGALLYIADSGNVLLGGAALLALGLGMGAPLLVVGTVGAQLLPKPGSWMNAVKAVFGFVLLATAVWMLARVLTASITLALWGGLALTAGVTLWLAIGRRAPRLGAAAGATAMGLLLGLWGALMVVGAAAGASNPWQPLAFAHAASHAPGTSVSFDASGTTTDTDRFRTIHDMSELEQALRTAAQQGRWTVVDFYADWCVSCKVIDRTVFGNADVQQALAEATLLRPDVTDDDADSRELLQAFHILGPPTILFIGPDGRTRREARVVGELSAEEFLTHWQHAHDAPLGQRPGDTSS